MVFKVGDKVMWRSQAGGHWLDKYGEVVEVVPRGTMPTTKLKDPGMPRYGIRNGVEEPSYVVRTVYVMRNGVVKRVSKVYWPYAPGLVLVNPSLLPACSPIVGWDRGLET